MRHATIIPLKSWYRNGKRLNVSPTSIPTDYNPKTDEIEKNGHWGWYDHQDNTQHARPDIAKTREEVAQLLVSWGYAQDLDLDGTGDLFAK